MRNAKATVQSRAVVACSRRRLVSNVRGDLPHTPSFRLGALIPNHLGAGVPYLWDAKTRQELLRRRQRLRPGLKFVPNAITTSRAFVSCSSIDVQQKTRLLLSVAKSPPAIAQTANGIACPSGNRVASVEQFTDQSMAFALSAKKTARSVLLAAAAQRNRFCNHHVAYQLSYRASSIRASISSANIVTASRMPESCSSLCDA